MKDLSKTPLLLAISVLLVTACSGDGRPLTEAVEANRVELKSLTIKPPKGRLNNLVVNPGELLTLQLEGVDKLNKDVEVASSNRRWSVDNTAVLNVDDYGNVYAVAEGTANVNVRIAGVASNRFPIKVRNETLTALTEIVGMASVDRCLPQEYQAKGQFFPVDGIGEGSIRGLVSDDVKWSVDNSVATMGRASNSIAGFSSVTGVNVGSLRLTASLDGKSIDRVIEVENTLQGIDITPLSNYFVKGKDLQLSAKGYYVRSTGESPNVDITDGVQWRAKNATSVFTVSNSADTKGLVSPKVNGQAQLTASCGDLIQEKTVSVGESGEASSDGLAIEGPSIRNISLNGGDQQLRASVGASFNADDGQEVTNVATWSVSKGADVVSFSPSVNGLLSPLKAGDATVRVSYDNKNATVSIKVE